MLLYHRKNDEPVEASPNGTPHHHPVERTIHVLENLINAFSEQQSVAGLSLIVVAGHDGCELSAYIYNLICFQLIMSLISHLNALTNTRNWFGAKDQSLLRGILNGFVQYMILIFDLIVVGFIFAIALLKKIKHHPDGFRAKISLILRTASTIATTGTLCWLSVQYIVMRRDMEKNPEWYDAATSSNQYSYYNVVTWALFASSLITIFKAFAGKSVGDALSRNTKKNPG